ncbi:MAG: glycosyltransferase [Cytophagales bacterium]|nr:glycosyltransferase [Cytophaga sp.]
MHYLVCDLNIQKKGHYIGYNQYILNTIAKLEEEHPDKHYSFLYNSEAKEYLDFPEYTSGRIHFLNDNCWSNTSMRDKIVLFKKVIASANQLKTDHLIFMDLDQYQFPIFISSFSFKLSGILFRPHHRITFSNNSLSSRVSSRIQRLKKILAEKLLTTKKEIEHIYILNDEQGVQHLNRFHKTTQFTYLKDPIFSYPSSLQTAKDNKIIKFLIFGAINERKNITAILKAYDTAHFTDETELLIVGSSDKSYLVYLNNLIQSLTTINNRKRITLKADFVSNEEMDNYFHQSDVCLLIYKDFYGSSGLLGRAALHKRKVIGANVGLLKELIEQNTLGITCDPNSVEDISKSLTAIVHLQLEDKNFESFYQQYSPETFIRTLLQ